MTRFTLFLDPVEKDSGKTTSYSGRIDSQSGRTGHQAKGPASVHTLNNESGFSCQKNKSSGCAKFKLKPYFLEYSTLNL